MPAEPAGGCPAGPGPEPLFHSSADARRFGAPLLRLFVTALARPPSLAELRLLVARARAGDDVGAASNAMAGSDEFLARHGPEGAPDRHYLRALFWASGGDDPSEAEAETLLGQPQATRASLLAQVSQSAAARLAITLEHDFYSGLLPPDDDVAYQLWLEAGGEDGPAGRVPPAAKTSQHPAIAIVVRVGSTRPDLLLETLASLRAQTSAHWEALLVGQDLSCASWVAAAQAAAADGRITLVDAAASSRGEAMMRGVASALGNLIGFVEAGDRLAPDMVAVAADTLAHSPGLRLIYTDEDRIAADGTRSGAIIKGGWSPDLLLAGDALGQLVLFRRDLLPAEGEAAGDYATLDWALRLTLEAPAGAVTHLPHILFHRGRLTDDRPPPFPRNRAGNGDALLDAVIGRHLADRPTLRLGTMRRGGLIWPVVEGVLPDPAPLVSVIIPTRDRAHLLRETMTGLLGATGYSAIEVLVMDNGSSEPEALHLLSEIAADPRVRVLRVPGPFNWSAVNNAGAAEASGEVLLLLNNDVSIVEPGWLQHMVGHVMRPDVGVVGARLLFPDGHLQHGGVLLGPGGTAVHAMTGAGADDPGYCAQVALVRDLSAVTGACLAIRRAVFQQVGGLEQEVLRLAWSDIDLCLRVREAGYRVLWDAGATLIHHEQATRGRDVTIAQQARHEVERTFMRIRWPEAFEHDPFLNPQLRATGATISLAMPAGAPGAPAR